MAQSFRIFIDGSFDVIEEGRGSCKPSVKKDCAIIALLAAAPRMKRSRSWLKGMLWPDKDEQAASANLRQAIWRIKKIYSCEYELLHSNSQEIWLNEDIVSVCSLPSRGGEFLEGFDLNEEPFEDWLRTERSTRDYVADDKTIKQNAPSTSHVGHQNGSNVTLPVIVILPVREGQAGSAIVGIANFIIDRLVSRIEGLSSSQFHDLRVVGDFHSRNGVMNSESRVDYYIEAKCARHGGDAHFTMSLIGALRRNLCMQDSIAIQNVDKYKRIGENIHFFIERISFQIASKIYESKNENVLFDPVVFSIFDLFSSSQDRQLVGLDRLKNSREHSGLSHAWLAYAEVVCGAECALSGAENESVAEGCARALELAPYSPAVNSIVGHIRGFYFKDINSAADHLKVARKIDPHSSVVLSFSAAWENYFGSPNRAFKYAKEASSINPSSFMRFVFDCDLQMSLALAGQHNEAVQLGERVRRTNPQFLGAKRYLAASYVQVGNFEQARRIADEVRSLDKDFTSKGVARLDYPLPSERSLDLVRESLRVLEFK